MSLTRTLATSKRVLEQLSHDRRSIALLMLMPSVLLLLFKYVYDDNPMVFNRIGPQMLGLFPFIIMFLITSITMVRERTSGTLERLLTTPLQRGELILGYALAFAVAALVQSLVSSAVAIWLLDLTVQTPWVVVVFAVLDALLGTALGLLMSAFATTEFQAVQFMPMIIVPQILLCGLLAPRDQMVDVLRWISNVLPLSYATDAFTEATVKVGFTEGMWTDAAVVGGFMLASIVLASMTLRRRTP